jgi:hypothetical protein
MRLVHGNNKGDVNFKTLLKGSKHSVSLVTDGQEGHWKNIYIKKEYQERDTAVPDVTDNITILLNPASNSNGVSECESSDTTVQSDCSSSRDMELELVKSV